MKYENLLYFYNLNTIGGIETWFYNLSVLYKDLDITVVVSKGSIPQINRLSKNIRVVVWDGKSRFECKNLFINFNGNILPYVKADKVYLVLHGDYEDMVKRKQLNYSNLPLYNGVDEYIGITKLVCEAWERLTGIKATLCYNPVLVPNENKTIRICSAQRMTREKGRDRIIALAKALDDVCKITGNRWIWDIYTDDKSQIINDNIYYRSPRLDITEYFRGYDWFVALSDNEGYCYSVVENLYRGIPCVVTDLPVFKELNLNETNSLKLDMNMLNIFEVANDMFNKKLSFEYQPPKDNWGFLFGKNKSTYTYKEEERMTHKVEALDTYTRLKVKDNALDRILPEGFVFEVDDKRLDVLLGNNRFKQPFVKLVQEEVKEEVKEEIVDEVKPVEEVQEEIEQPVKKEKKPRKKKKK